MATKTVCRARTLASIVSHVRFLERLELRKADHLDTELDLPEYDSYEALRSHVYTAMTAGSEYFGFA